MNKKYYEKGRLRYFSRQQLIVFDYPTIAAICYSIAIFFFGSLILLSLKQWTKILDAVPPQTSKSVAEEKKEGDSMALDFIETPAEILQQVKAQEKAPLLEKIAENIETKPEEKIVKIEPKFLPQPIPEIKPLPTPTPAVKKVEPVAVNPEKKAPAAIGSTSIVPGNQSPVDISSTTETAETEEHIFYRKILESMIEEKLKPYKSDFPEKWKAIAGSYIVDIDINESGQISIKEITSSPNFFFNQLSDVIIKSLKYPQLKKYGLKTYHQTFIFTYRPYGNK